LTTRNFILSTFHFGQLWKKFNFVVGKFSSAAGFSCFQGILSNFFDNFLDF